MKKPFTITDHLNKKLHAVKWESDHEPKGVVLIVHGMAEHCERYSHFANFLNENGYHAIAYDHRGHGKTDPDQLGIIDDDDCFHLMVKNLNDVYMYVSESFPELPLVLFGHSMGSFITQRFMQLYDAEPAALIYSGSNGKPPLMIHAGILTSALLKTLFGKHAKSNLINNLTFGDYNNHFKPNRTDFDWLSRDTDMVDLCVDDPLCGFICSNSFYNHLFNCVKKLHSHPKFADHNPEIPTLLIAGDQDPVSEMGKGIKNLEKILSKSGVRDVTTHLYEGGRHEMLNEINRDEVFDNFIQWLNQKLLQSVN